ncbi:glycosyltransferase family 2 protein [Glaesserella parasuis]|uniref:glycosyltransferase family 2 protein n=2 Tax=Glaesserella parasuis TaxID=738 RepID=UPI0024365180|nr:glycosyltransferase family 2 protein [Glaesserella parasuis]MDG6470535.1 glycosyltransferase family 2 protein [Glaesserella parasuis]
MRFSVIIPVYNVEKYIIQCLNSVVYQSFSDIEVILVNDGSKDSSGTICDEYAKNDTRIKVIHKENGGLSSARNVGLKSAVGEYILFLDSDDFWLTERFLEDIDRVIETSSNNLDMIVFPFSYYLSDNKNIDYTFNDIISNGDFRNDFIRLIENNIYTASACNKCIKRSILTDNKILFPIDRLSEDILWCAELSSFIENYVIYNYPVYAYRQNRINSLTYKISKRNIYDILRSIDDIYISSRFRRRQEDTIFSTAILTYLSKCFLDIIPYVGNLYHDSDIKYFIDKYLFLLKYSKNIKGGKRIIQFCVKFFGLRMSLFILFYLMKLYKLIRF